MPKLPEVKLCADIAHAAGRDTSECCAGCHDGDMLTDVLDS